MEHTRCAGHTRVLLRTTNFEWSASTSGYVAIHASGGGGESSRSLLLAPRNSINLPPGRRKACSVFKVRVSMRTARIETRSRASCSSARGRSSSNRDVSTSASRRPERANRFAQEHALAGLDFDHPERKVAAGQLERDRRRASARTGIQEGAGVFRNVARGNDRLDDQPIDRLIVAPRDQTVGREIDLGVPFREELIVGLEAFDQSRLEGNSSRLRSRLSRSRNSLLATSRTEALCRPVDSESIEVGSNDRHSRRRNSRDSLGLTERFRPGFRESLDHFSREAGYSLKRKGVGNAAPLGVLGAID